MLVITGSAEASKREEARQLGVDDYLAKPTSISDLTGTIAGIMSRGKCNNL